jgi:hypothetical protein
MWSKLWITISTQSTIPTWKRSWRNLKNWLSRGYGAASQSIKQHTVNTLLVQKTGQVHTTPQLTNCRRIIARLIPLLQSKTFAHKKLQIFGQKMQSPGFHFLSALILGRILLMGSLGLRLHNNPMSKASSFPSSRYWILHRSRLRPSPPTRVKLGNFGNFFGLVLIWLFFKKDFQKVLPILPYHKIGR